MPGPPTPVSGCPLKRLEIRDGGSVKAFNSCRPQSIFTLTIEGERPIDAEMGTLILLIYQGVQQVVSVRLGDLARNSQSPNEIVSIDKHLNQLCITIPGKSQSIMAQFEEKRDFNVTVCLLQKSDLHISESIPSSPSVAHAPFDPSNHRSRLSSIPPMAFVPPSAPGFGAEGFPGMDTHLHPSLRPMPYPMHPQRTASVPIYPSPSVPIYSHPSVPPDMAHLNPYNMFLGRGSTTMHVPRVGSPLRHSFSQEPQPPPSSHAGSVSDGFSPTNSQSFMGGGGFHASVSPGVVENREKTPVDTNQSPKADPQAFRSKSNDFRDLMPQPRKLPFESRPKRSISRQDSVVRDETPKPSPRAKRARDPVNETASNAASQRAETKKTKASGPRVNRTLRSTSTPSPSPLAPQSMPEKMTKKKCSRDAECQTERAVKSSSVQCVTETQLPTANQMILITDPDPDALRELDEATAGLFEQYEADIASGSDSQASDRFYLDQIYLKRRDFWLAKLEEMGGR